MSRDQTTFSSLCKDGKWKSSETPLVLAPLVLALPYGTGSNFFDFKPHMTLNLWAGNVKKLTPYKVLSPVTSTCRLFLFTSHPNIKEGGKVTWDWSRIWWLRQMLESIIYNCSKPCTNNTLTYLLLHKRY